MKLSDADTRLYEKVIELYRAERLLWDKKDQRHSDKMERDMAMMRIGRGVGETGILIN